MTCNCRSAACTAMEFDQLPVCSRNDDGICPSGHPLCRACTTIGHVLDVVLVRVFEQFSAQMVHTPAPAIQTRAYRISFA